MSGEGSLRRRLSSLRGAWRWSTGYVFRKVKALWVKLTHGTEIVVVVFFARLTIMTRDQCSFGIFFPVLDVPGQSDPEYQCYSQEKLTRKVHFFDAVVVVVVVVSYHRVI